MSIGERIKAARTALQMTQTDLAQALGTRQSTITSWETNVSNPRRKTLQALSNILGVTLIALEFGEGDREHWDDVPKEDKTSNTPLVGTIGSGGHIATIKEDSFDTVENPPEINKSSLALRVTGNSMLPLLKDGALIYYSKHYTNVRNYLHEMVICHFTDGRKAIKIITLGTVPNRYTLTALNEPPMRNEQIKSISPIDWMKP